MPLSYPRKECQIGSGIFWEEFWGGDIKLKVAYVRSSRELVQKEKRIVMNEKFHCLEIGKLRRKQ